MLKVIPLILICLHLITPIYAQSIRSVNNSVNAPSTASYFAQNSYKEQSGYNTSVQVIDQEKQFDRIGFKPIMFGGWYNLFIRAHVYSIIDNLKQDGHVHTDGSLKNSVLALGMGLTPNQVINEQELIKYLSVKYPLEWVYNELIRVNVIGSDGFLVGTESFSKQFNEDDFQPYLPKINGISFGFKTSAINNELATELLHFLKEFSMSIVVTQEETTRYQSRKSNFVDGFLDQLGGNALGNLFYKDKVKTVKQKLTYSPNIDVLNLFPAIDIGFSKAPYLKGSKGDVIYYGSPTQKQARASYGHSKLLDVYYVGVSFINQGNSAYTFKSLSFSGWQLDLNQIRDQSDDDLTVMGGRYVMGAASKKSIYNLSFGLSAKTASDRGDTQLGFGIGGIYTYHIMRYLGVFGLVDSNFGIDFNNESGTSWQLSRLQLGLKTTLSMVNISCGYEWQTGKDNATLFEGLVTGIGLYF